jgi:tryptophanase
MADMMNKYTVGVRNTFEATDPEDAVQQMIEWLLENAQSAGYNVYPTSGGTYMFIDANKIWGNASDATIDATSNINDAMM